MWPVLVARLARSDRVPTSPILSSAGQTVLMTGDAAARVRQFLLDSRFTTDGVLAHVGPEAFAALGRDQTVPIRRAMAAADEPTRLDALIKLFLLGDRVPVHCLPNAAAADLTDLGLIQTDLDEVIPLLEVHPYGEPDTDWYVVSDLGAPQAADHVLGIGGASLTLARITPRRAVGRTLDLGCGAGVQVLHAARHCGRIVATDTNPRALALTRLSAALSGVPTGHLDLREGSLFDPVSDELFDLIVSNPPFVISPSHRFSYRDAGLAGDELSRLVVRGAASHLAPGGMAAVLVNWLHVADQDWRERVSQWVAGTGVDAWIVQRDVQPVADYAATWLRDAQVPEGPAFEVAMDEWLDAFANEGGVGVGFGWFVLQAPAAPGAGAVSGPGAGPGSGATRWVHVEDLTHSERLPRGDEVLAYLDGCSLIETRPVPALLAGHARLADDVSVTTTTHHAAGSRTAAPPRLGLVGSVGAAGWRPSVVVPTALLDALLADPDRSIGERIDAAALAEGLDPLDILGPALTGLRELVRVGIVRTS